MGPPNGRVHEHNELVAADIWDSAAERPPKRAPVIAYVLVEDVASIAGQVWQGQLGWQNACTLHAKFSWQGDQSMQCAPADMHQQHIRADVASADFCRRCSPYQRR